jgi:phage shock protein PspC (stress-responsive transcriptional regulator)
MDASTNETPNDATRGREPNPTSAGSTPPVPPAPPTTPPPAPRRLTRRTDQKVIAGVCAGLGEYFNLDPVLFRVGFVVLAILGGTGGILYLLAWWLLPVQSGVGAVPTQSVGQRSFVGMRGGSAWIWAAVIVAGVAVLLSDIGNHGALPWAFRPGIVWGIALILFGVLLYQRTGARRTDAEPAGLPAGTVALDAAGTDAAGPARYAPAAYEGAATTPPTAPVPVGYPVPSGTARSRERSQLGWITLGLAMLAVGGAALVDQADGVRVTLAQYFAIAIAVLGLGLLVGTVWGRARWLIVPALLLIPFMLAASLIDVPLTGGTGTRSYQPTSVAEIPPSYRLAAGELNLDLSNVALSGASTSVTATVGFGRLVVVVPNDVPVTVHALVGGGQIRIEGAPFGPPDHQVDGVRVRLDQTVGPVSLGAGALTLNVQAGFGQITVDSEAPAPVLG